MDQHLQALFSAIVSFALISVVIAKLASDAFDRKHNPRD